MTEENRWDDEAPSNHLDSVAPSDTGPSLDVWLPEPAIEEPVEKNVDWETFDALPLKEKQRVLGVPVTGVWGDRSERALKEARGE